MELISTSEDSNSVQRTEMDDAATCNATASPDTSPPQNRSTTSDEPNPIASQEANTNPGIVDADNETGSPNAQPSNTNAATTDKLIHDEADSTSSSCSQSSASIRKTPTPLQIACTPSTYEQTSIPADNSTSRATSDESLIPLSDTALASSDAIQLSSYEQITALQPKDTAKTSAPARFNSLTYSSLSSSIFHDQSKKPTSSTHSTPAPSPLERRSSLAAPQVNNETLMVLLKRKGKELKALQAKLEQMEGRYSDILRDNRTLLSNQNLFVELLEQSNREVSLMDVLLEEEEVLSKVTLESMRFKEYLQTLSKDISQLQTNKSIFRNFILKVFKADAEIQEMMCDENYVLDVGLLESKWAAYEGELRTASIEGEEMMRMELEKQKMICKALQEEDERLNERVEQLNELAATLNKEKADLLMQSMATRKSFIAQNGQQTSKSDVPKARIKTAKCSMAVQTEYQHIDASVQTEGFGAPLKTLQKPNVIDVTAKEAPDISVEGMRRLNKCETLFVESGSCGDRDVSREEASHNEGDVGRSGINRGSKEANVEAYVSQDMRSEKVVEDSKSTSIEMNKQYQQLKKECELLRIEARKALLGKEKSDDKLKQKMSQYENQSESSSLIEELARQQASRDVEVRLLHESLSTKEHRVEEARNELLLERTQANVLKERIRELESRLNREGADMDYLKNVLLQYVKYSQKGDMKAKKLLPVIATLLSLSNEERSSLTD